MPLIVWSTTSAKRVLKQHSLITTPGKIKLDEEGKNFTKWKEQLANYVVAMSFDDLFMLGLADATNPYPIHDLFPTECNFLDICS